MDPPATAEASLSKISRAIGQLRYCHLASVYKTRHWPIAVLEERRDNPRRRLDRCS